MDWLWLADRKHYTNYNQQFIIIIINTIIL